MDERHIRRAVGNLRCWCVEIFESGPYWCREEVISLIESCDEACSMMMDVIFQVHPVFWFGGELENRVVRFCRRLGRRAPEGWHSRLMKKNKSYREAFRQEKA